eukprot:TRINITY_DN4046_c0_g1_i1.p1 TRINITY_DN4046_c0_g1~~TRINITY_DN4046_c0_g1_i1.p1  ORF type:complete len:555 (-),score=34.34 TRINITY_DN4046_c0_g1_i1:138-1802(-)
MKLYIYSNRQYILIASIWLIVNLCLSAWQAVLVTSRCNGYILGEWSFVGLGNNTGCNPDIVFGSCISNSANISDYEYLPPSTNANSTCLLPPCNLFGRVLGHNLNLNMALLLLPVTKHSVWSHLFKIPFERAIVLHKGLGVIVFVMAAVHLSTWWATFPVGSPSWICLGWKLQFNSPMFIGHLAFICMLIAVCMSISIIRRRCFEVFFYTHHIFLVTYAFAALHTIAAQATYDPGSTFPWKEDSFLYYLVVPAVLYIVDHILRLSSFVPSKIVALSSETEGITLVKVMKKNFQFSPGQYCFVCVPKLSLLQWHPFSISSSPANPEIISFHIKEMGENSWSHRLAQLALFEYNPDQITVLVDGPYGKLQINPENYSVVVFIAGGIGVTHCISILSDMLDRPHLYPKVNKVYFNWVIRHPSQAAWFSTIWERILRNDENALSLTGINESEDDMDSQKILCNIEFKLKFFVTDQPTSSERSSLIPYKKTAVSIPNSCFSKGRPEPAEIFQEISSECTDYKESDSFGVFVCAPSSLARSVESECFSRKWDIHRERYYL